MGAFAILLLLLCIAVVAGGVAFGLALARRGREGYAAQGEIIPGVPSEAPAEWAGAHSREAKLHRRLGDAVRALRAQERLEEDVAALELRVELEQHALAVDRRLIAAAALPASQRDRALAEVEVSVAAVEEAAADLARSTATRDASADVMGLEDLRGRIEGMRGTGEA